jgi:hypothetical protein
MNEIPGFFEADLVADMSMIRDKLTVDLVKSKQRSRLAVIVFANERKPFVKNEILPLVPYWNYRSRDHVSFFFVGHSGDASVDESGYYPATTSFDDETFANVIEEFENRSNWDYRGDTPLIICRGYLRYHKNTGEPRAFLDLDDSVIEFELERALRIGVADSIESVFEAIIKAAKETPGGKVQWKLSAALGGRALSGAILEAVSSKLPGARRVFDAVRSFRVR